MKARDLFGPLLSVTTASLIAWACVYLLGEYVSLMNATCGTARLVVLHELGFEVPLLLCFCVAGWHIAEDETYAVPVASVATIAAIGSVLLSWTFLHFLQRL